MLQIFFVGLDIPDRSPSPPKVVTDSNRIGAEEDIEEFKGLTDDQIRELVELREAKANAQVLEMVGDIPDADAKPPENILFVCKLNPVTTDEDLEIIFSRFGPILSCEVIRDQKSGDSLQYAFIEFENEEDCIKAYFKMDNVLIDDRRIHVDFSQSLAKVKGVSRRKYSEEEPVAKEKEKSRKGGDGLVAKKKVSQGGGGYEMVFNEDEEVVGGRKLAKMSDGHDGGAEVGGERRGGERRGGERRGREREQEGHNRKMEERERDRGQHRHHRRSRSRSHERRHKKHRSRSRSHDRKRYDKKSHDHQHKRRDRSRSRERFRRK